tara:strand:- start:2544 stop:3587 length:1044 start_codon:yes stop_codon:yes gene_type:complete
MKIKGHLDLFSGIGGFSLGLKQAGIEPRWLGFSDIDKYANKLFKRRFPNAEQLGSITDVSYKSLKGQDIELLSGGFPCQAFSLAGKREGFDDTRGTLFFEIQRILEDYIKNGKPISCILLENVKGLLNHDNGRTFATIYGILSDLNYTVECQLVNTKWWLPQNRERIYMFGRYNGNPSGRKIFPIFGNGGKINLNQIGIIGEDSEATRVYDTTCARTIKNGGGMGAKTGLYKVYSTQMRNPNRPSLTRICDCGSKKLYKKCCGTDGGYGILSKNDGSVYCLDSTNSQAVEIKSAAIRRLTPTECERLQGFPDGWTDGQSDTQRYKQCGNAVSVPVTEAIFRRIYKCE